MLKRLLGQDSYEDPYELPKVDYAAEAESIKAELDEEPPYVVAPLPPYQHGVPCPKCHFTAGTTTYRKGHHRSCSIPGAPEDYPYSFGAGYIRSLAVAQARYGRQIAAIPEHFERKCPNCSHEWSEALV